MGGGLEPREAFANRVELVAWRCVRYRWWGNWSVDALGRCRSCRGLFLRVWLNAPPVAPLTLASLPQELPSVPPSFLSQPQLATAVGYARLFLADPRSSFLHPRVVLFVSPFPVFLCLSSSPPPARLPVASRPCCLVPYGRERERETRRESSLLSVVCFPLRDQASLSRQASENSPRCNYGNSRFETAVFVRATVVVLATRRFCRRFSRSFSIALPVARSLISSGNTFTRRALCLDFHLHDEHAGHVVGVGWKSNFTCCSFCSRFFSPCGEVFRFYARTTKVEMTNSFVIFCKNFLDRTNALLKVRATFFSLLSLSLSLSLFLDETFCSLSR